MRSEFNDWYEKWTGSKVKCENTDIIGAWQHQQSKVDELQKRINDSQDIIESILARSLDNPEIQDLCGQLIDVLEQGIEGGSDE
ncbi:hypothetical protein [Acinetobacter venetianus]|uniref:hypothetical protein n=1 Tax=Acinetobacter venetianus TaxID=52133 RepID=UPI0021500529|nr:hypothetical protein [Acinetobacter venetianus]MCR4532725.1 hypothetical protein [Acinetobacter venetianus]